MAVEAITGWAQEDRPFAAFADREVECPCGAGREGDHHDLAAFAHDREGPMAALEAEAFDVRAGCFGDPQAVQAQETDQRVVTGDLRGRPRRATSRPRYGPGRSRAIRSRGGVDEHAPQVNWR